jgi:hypothetical protein
MIQKILLIIGLAYAFACFALPLSYTYNSEESDVVTNFKGFECESYYINLVLIAGILCSSFIGRGSYIAFFIILGLVGGFLVFLNSMKDVAPGLPYGYYLTYYQYLLYLADVMVVIAGLLQIIQSKKLPK